MSPKMASFHWAAQQRVILQHTDAYQALCWKERIHVFVIILETGLALCQSAKVRILTCFHFKFDSFVWQVNVLIHVTDHYNYVSDCTRIISLGVHSIDQAMNIEDVKIHSVDLWNVHWRKLYIHILWHIHLDFMLFFFVTFSFNRSWLQHSKTTSWWYCQLWWNWIQ